MAKQDDQHEPTMEEILSTIRKAVSEEVESGSADDERGEDKGSETAAHAMQSEDAAGSDSDEVLELTRKVHPDGSITELEPSGATSNANSDDDQGNESVSDKQDDEGTGPTEPSKDPFAEAAGSAAMTKFVESAEKKEVAPGPYVGADRSLEDVVREALRPHLRSWLEDNLAPLVQNIVREEIERMVRRDEER